MRCVQRCAAGDHFVVVAVADLTTRVSSPLIFFAQHACLTLLKADSAAAVAWTAARWPAAQRDARKIRRC
jgi:hypothetical protein